MRQGPREVKSAAGRRNMVEQDHRGVKLRIKPMLGFQVFDRAAVTIAGVELLHRIRKGQFNLRRRRLKGQAESTAIWIAVLSA
ncbi:DDE-type integrase/transposase/recombinase [Variovorax humicola]|uniref:DDE-type integrase/transposase/recombinase n=1 Tax=Variovorax humicola TaxID=1769758 RepID=A0ABU8VXT9_9BURK